MSGKIKINKAVAKLILTKNIYWVIYYTNIKSENQFSAQQIKLLLIHTHNVKIILATVINLTMSGCSNRCTHFYKRFYFWLLVKSTRTAYFVFLENLLTTTFGSIISVVGKSTMEIMEPF